MAIVQESADVQQGESGVKQTPGSKQAKVEQLFSDDGPLSLHLKAFEMRAGQQEMSGDILQAFQENQVALIEAGTGIGKSFAYLIPAIIWAQETGERVVISTNTIALQEQLIEKDIPLALKVLNLHMKVVLAKGMRNYVCLRKLHEETSSITLLQDRTSDELQNIHEWSKTTKIGSRSELSFFPHRGTWDKVGVDPDACNNSQCPSFKECFFFGARKETYDAKIVICNHHLLFADLAARKESENYSGHSVLPPFQRLIIDEAHHIEDVATEYFAERVSRLELLKILAQLGSDSEKSAGKLVMLKKRLYELPESGSSKSSNEKPSLLNRVEFDLAAARREAFSQAQDFFDSVTSFVSLFPLSKNEEEVSAEQKMRLKDVHFAHPFWKERITAQKDKLAKTLEDLGIGLQNLEKDIQSVKNERFQEATKSVRVDINAIALKLSTYSARLHGFLNATASDQKDPKIRWLEIVQLANNMEVRLITSEFDISKCLRENLFEKLSTTVLCSATLATQKRFNYMKKRLGIDIMAQNDSKKIAEKIYDSPFPYQTNALFGVPLDFPLPDQPNYLKSLGPAIIKLVQASRGNAFVLFTSYNMLKACYEAVYDQLHQEGYHLLKHGDDHRRELIRRFKEKPRSVLFGTDSFWEGVDVVGDALRSVIITKLPFQVPTEPLIEARVEAITAQGGYPFMEYIVPKAVVKFKQAFGRLIRHKEDRGCVVCLDARIIKKNYGKQFIQSLPDCYQVFEPLDVLAQKMRAFYDAKR